MILKAALVFQTSLIRLKLIDYFTNILGAYNPSAAGGRGDGYDAIFIDER